MSTNIQPNGKHVRYESAAGSIRFGVMKRSDISIRPIYDAGQRTVIASHDTLTIDMWIDDNGTGIEDNDIFGKMRKVLSTPGGELIVGGIGFGHRRTINVSGKDKDLNWEPKPRLLTFTPFGEHSAKVRWQVEWEQIECKDAPRSGLELMELSYKVHFSLDKSG